MVRKENQLNRIQTSFIFQNIEFPEGVEFLVFEKDGRFNEGRSSDKILENYTSKVPYAWLNYPEDVKRILYILDRLGFDPICFFGKESNYDVFSIEFKIEKTSCKLYFSEYGWPQSWLMGD